MISLIIEASTLLNVLLNMHSIIERRSLIPVMSNIMIRAEAGRLYFTAVNIDLEIRQEIEANVSVEGAITVNAGIFTDIVGKLSGGVLLSLQGESCIIEVNKAKFTLQTLPVDLFPINKEDGYEQNFNIDSEKLFYLLNNAAFAMSQDKSKSYLNGVFLHKYDGELCAVATDGHRLNCIVHDSFDLDLALTLPRKTILEILKLTKNYTGSIEIFYGESSIKFSFANLTLISKLLGGSFPNYRRIFSDEQKFYLKVEREILIRVVQRVSLVSSEKTHLVILHLRKNSLEISAESAERGSATELIEIIYGREEQKIGLNANYLLELLDRLLAKELTIAFDHSLGPIRLLDEARPKNIYILMPVRV